MLLQEMAGRPQGCACIVPLYKVMAPAAIAGERWRLGSHVMEINTTETCLQWVARRRLIRNEVQCTRCGQPASLVGRAECGVGVHWTMAQY